MKKLANYLAPFQEIDLSELLGISVAEYEMLHHSPLYQYQDSEGNVTEFFMYIHDFNQQDILHKLQLQEGNLVTFTPEAIYALRRWQLSIGNCTIKPFSSAVLLDHCQ